MPLPFPSERQQRVTSAKPECPQEPVRDAQRLIHGFLGHVARTPVACRERPRRASCNGRPLPRPEVPCCPSQTPPNMRNEVFQEQGLFDNLDTLKTSAGQCNRQRSASPHCEMVRREIRPCVENSGETIQPWYRDAQRPARLQQPGNARKCCYRRGQMLEHIEHCYKIKIPPPLGSFSVLPNASPDVFEAAYSPCVLDRAFVQVQPENFEAPFPSKLKKPSVPASYVEEFSSCLVCNQSCLLSVPPIVSGEVTAAACRAFVTFVDLTVLVKRRPRINHWVRKPKIAIGAKQELVIAVSGDSGNRGDTSA